MKRVITGAIMVPIALAVIFAGNFFWVLLVAGLIAELAAWEYFSISDKSGTLVPRAAVMAAIVIVFAATLSNSDLELPAVSICSLALFAVCAFRSPASRVLVDTASSVFALVYIGVSLLSLPLIWSEPHGASLVLYLLFVVWFGDVAALYVGRAFGRRKLAPTISPNKTWEGSAASMIGSLAAAVLLYYVARSWGANPYVPLSYTGPIYSWLVLAVVLNIAAQIGDLVESAIKRGSGVKDSGKLLPGHGGILDRIDALLLAAPVLWYARFIERLF